MATMRIGRVGALLMLAALALLAGCQRTHVEQRGYRGLGMNENYSAATLAAQEAVNKVPVPLRKANPAGQTAAEFYTNVQVLGDLSKGEFARLMLSFKSWVAPEEGCNYCHNAPDYASDEKYPKRVARLMISMTRRVNADWTTHVKGTGVTCYTCHRGQPVPPRVWTAAPDPVKTLWTQHKPGAHLPTPSASRTALPADALSDYLLNDKPIRVVGLEPLQHGNRNSISSTRYTYSLMMVMTESLGVNCTFCHNSRAFYSWELSTPQRATAWYGIRMVRDLNNAYVAPLAGILPAARLGPTGDSPKVYCATCHLGSNKPLNGAQMVKDFPELISTKAQRAQAEAAAASAAASSAAPAAVAGDRTLVSALDPVHAKP